MSESGRDVSGEHQEWVDVDIPSTNSCQVLLTPVVLAPGSFKFFRVKLTTPRGVYYSAPIGKEGVLNRRDWLMAREIVRKERIRYKFSGVPGYLLKPRVGGEVCPRCLDPMTDEPTDMNCPVCYGTGKRCGYYEPIACQPVIFQGHVSNADLSDDAIGRPINDIQKIGRFLLSPPAYSRDIWINANTDERYVIREISHEVKIKDVPLVAKAKFVLLPVNDAAYNVPIPPLLSKISDGC
jgi:hypothetical protein